VQKDMPLYALQELGGGKVRRMVRRYAHLTAEHVAPYAERLGEAQVAAERIHGTNPSQCQK